MKSFPSLTPAYAGDQEASGAVRDLCTQPPRVLVPDSLGDSIPPPGCSSTAFLCPPGAPGTGGLGGISSIDALSLRTSTEHRPAYLSPGRFVFLVRGAGVQPRSLHVWFHPGRPQNHLVRWGLSWFRVANAGILADAD